jgi:proteasome activator subunit 4
VNISVFAFDGISDSNFSHEIPEMIPGLEPINSSFCLTDPTDHRFQYMLALRTRFAHFLHKASGVLRTRGEENTVDAVMILVSHALFLVKVGITNGVDLGHPNIFA